MISLSRFRFLAAFAGFVAALSLPLVAADAPSTMQRGAAYALDPADNHLIAIPLESTEVILDVKPGLLETQVIQSFVNRTPTALEATYLYPLPEKATITDCELRFPDGRIVRSLVREKAAAKAVYETAKAEGKKAALITQHDPMLFSSAVANFLPGERVEIVIKFIQPLAAAEDHIAVRFPMVSGDKYFPREAVPGTPGNSAPDPERRPEGVITQNHVYAFDIQVAGIPVQRIESSTHRIDVINTHSTPERYKIALKETVTIPDRDFELRIALRPEAALQPTVVTQSTATGNYGVLSFFPPRQQRKAPAAIKPRDVLFLIDHSGSMQDERMNSAKLGVRACLDLLSPQDRFQIVIYDHRFSFYAPEWVQGGREAFADAHTFVRSILADGGTELQPALAASLAAFEPNHRQQILILMTDGDVGNYGSLLNLVESKIGQVRLFAFGIGAAPNASLIRRISEIGRGQPRFIENDATVARELEDLFATLDAPVLEQPRLTLLDAQGAALEYTMFPARLPDLFSGRPVQASFRTRTGVPVTAVIEGLENGRPLTQRVALQQSVLRGDGLEKQFGQSLYIDTEMMLHRATTDAERKVIREEMLATALQYQLVTELTSRVAVEERVSRVPSAPLASQKVAQYAVADANGDTIVLTPFEVSTEEDRGYAAGNSLSSGRVDTPLAITPASMSVLTEEFMEDFALTNLEDAFLFAIDPQTHALGTQQGVQTNLLNGLPLATVIDPATIRTVSPLALREAGVEIQQDGSSRSRDTQLVARVWDGGAYAGSLRLASGRAEFGTSLLGLLSMEQRDHRHTGALFEVAQDFLRLKLRAGVQWRDLDRYGAMRLARGGFDYRLGGTLFLKFDLAWHDLRRDDARQFRLGAPLARYEGLGFVGLDLLTAETRRVQDQVGQLRLTGKAGALHQWSATLRQHAQQSAWLVPVVDAGAPARRQTWTVAVEDQIVPSANTWRADLHLATSGHRTAGTMDADRQTTDLAAGVRRELGKIVAVTANAFRKESLPWVTTGVWRPDGPRWLAVAAPVEVRTGGQAGLNLTVVDRRLSAHIAAFQERVSGLSYRSWSWEQAHLGQEEWVASAGGLRAAASRDIAPDFQRAGWSGGVTFAPNREFFATASWDLGLKNQGPYRGGQDRAYALIRHERRLGGGRHWLTAAFAVEYRDTLVFDDGFTLGGGMRADAMLGYRERGGNAETEIRLNLSNLADRPWQLTRFAPARGREFSISVTQSF